MEFQSCYALGQGLRGCDIEPLFVPVLPGELRVRKFGDMHAVKGCREDSEPDSQTKKYATEAEIEEAFHACCSCKAPQPGTGYPPRPGTCIEPSVADDTELLFKNFKEKKTSRGSRLPQRRIGLECMRNGALSGKGIRDTAVVPVE